MPDLVNHPPHYAGAYKDIDCIDAIRAALGRQGFICFLQGQVLKYTWRLGRKGEPEDVATDARKAQWYQAKLIEVLDEPF